MATRAGGEQVEGVVGVGQVHAGHRHTRPDGAAVPSPPTGPAPATTSCPGSYRVSAARTAEAGATLAVGDDLARSLVLTTLGVVILALVTVSVAVPLAVATYQARSRTPR